jgi:hypothetical protein
MNRYGFCDQFKQGNAIRLKELFNELHSAYKIRNTLYKDIAQHEVILDLVGVKLSTATNMLTTENNTRVVLSKRAKGTLPLALLDSIKAFNNICIYKIPKLKHELKITRLLYEMPDALYFRMQYWFNREIGNHILRGGVYQFGQGLSTLNIMYTKRSPNSKPSVDWGESNKLKKRLIEQGYTVKSKDHPDGIKWLLFHTSDGYCFWRWFKRDAFTPNKQMYRFRAIANNNEPTDYHGELTQEQILDKSIGTFDKMMALLKLNPQIIEKYVV